MLEEGGEQGYEDDLFFFVYLERKLLNFEIYVTGLLSSLKLLI